MRNTRMLWSLVAALAVAGCGDDAQHGGGIRDMSVPDMTARDLGIPPACSPTDPMNDGSPCSAGCPSGTIGVNLGGSCKCYDSCTTDTQCSCNRLCDPVSFADAGAGAACLPGNGPGERCGANGSGGVYGNGFCGQLTVCVNADAAKMFRYCNYKCESQADCPAETFCQPLYDSQGNTIGNVCAYNSGPNGNKDLGQTCTSSDVCKGGQLCDGTCLLQCDGPGATCATGSCTVVNDTASGKIIGYVCK